MLEILFKWFMFYAYYVAHVYFENVHASKSKFKWVCRLWLMSY